MKKPKNKLRLYIIAQKLSHDKRGFSFSLLLATKAKAKKWSTGELKHSHQFFIENDRCRWGLATGCVLPEVFGKDVWSHKHKKFHEAGTSTFDTLMAKVLVAKIPLDDCNGDQDGEKKTLDLSLKNLAIVQEELYKIFSSVPVMDQGIGSYRDVSLTYLFWVLNALDQLRQFASDLRFQLEPPEFDRTVHLRFAAGLFNPQSAPSLGLKPRPASGPTPEMALKSAPVAPSPASEPIPPTAPFSQSVAFAGPTFSSAAIPISTAPSPPTLSRPYAYLTIPSSSALTAFSKEVWAFSHRAMKKRLIQYLPSYTDRDLSDAEGSVPSWDARNFRAESDNIGDDGDDGTKAWVWSAGWKEPPPIAHKKGPREVRVKVNLKQASESKDKKGKEKEGRRDLVHGMARLVLMAHKRDINRKVAKWVGTVDPSIVSESGQSDAVERDVSDGIELVQGSNLPLGASRSSIGINGHGEARELKGSMIDEEGITEEEVWEEETEEGAIERTLSFAVAEGRGQKNLDPDRMDLDLCVLREMEMMMLLVDPIESESVSQSNATDSAAEDPKLEDEEEERVDESIFSFPSAGKSVLLSSSLHGKLVEHITPSEIQNAVDELGETVRMMDATGRFVFYEPKKKVPRSSNWRERKKERERREIEREMQRWTEEIERALLQTLA